MNLRQLRPVWAEVDLDVFEKNLRAIQTIVGPKCGVMAVVKADGYGHGATECALVAQEIRCRMLGVATLDEGVALRRAGLVMPILVLGHTPVEQAEAAVQNDIEITIYGQDTARALSSAATRLGRWAKVHIKVETGLWRLGILPGAGLQALLLQIASLPNLSITGIFTHFSASDYDPEYTRQQMARFDEALAQLPPSVSRGILRHSSNSAAILEFPETHLDMVRPGIIIFGPNPSRLAAGSMHFGAPLSLKARIGHLGNADVGETIGYGRTHTTARPTIVATLPIGYADGYSRALSNKGHVLIRGMRAPIIGRVSMDQLMVDATDIPGVRVGDEAVLIGRQGDLSITVDDLAAMVDTIPHEILTGIGARVPRVYRRGDSWYTIDPLTHQRVPVTMS